MGNTLKNCDEKDLLLWLEVGDNRQRQHTMNCLYSRFYSPVINWVVRNGGSEEDGHDALADALICLGDIVRSLKYKHQGKFESYFITIAKFKFYNICRKRKRENPKGGLVSIDDIFLNGIPDELIWENAFDNENIGESELIRLKMIDECLNRLGDKSRSRLIRFYYEKESFEVTFKALGDANAKVAKAMKWKCMEQLKTCIQKQKQQK